MSKLFLTLLSNEYFDKYMKKIQDLLHFVIIKDLNKNQIKSSSDSVVMIDYLYSKIWNFHVAIMLQIKKSLD